MTTYISNAAPGCASAGTCSAQRLVAGTSVQQPAETTSDSAELPARGAEHATQASARQQDDISEETGADATVGDNRQPSSYLPDSGSQQEAAQSAADDWGEFVS